MNMIAAQEIKRRGKSYHTNLRLVEVNIDGRCRCGGLHAGAVSQTSEKRTSAFSKSAWKVEAASPGQARRSHSQRTLRRNQRGSATASASVESDGAA